MAEELWQTLLRFHREIIAPDVREIVSTAIDSSVGGLRSEMNAHFDAVYKRFDRLETEFTAIKSALRRIE